LTKSVFLNVSHAKKIQDTSRAPGDRRTGDCDVNIEERRASCQVELVWLWTCGCGLVCGRFVRSGATAPAFLTLHGCREQEGEAVTWRRGVDVEGADCGGESSH
jgi:hypothetical protein